MTLLIWIIALLVSTSGAAEAAPVGALVAAVSGWFTGTFGAVVGGFLMRTAASVALSALSMAIRGKPKVPQPGITTQTTTTGGVVPQRLIFGTYATGGQHVCPPMVYQTDGNPNEWLVYVVSLADKPITALNRIIVNGKPLTIDGNPAAVGHTDAMGATVLDSGDDSLRGKLYVRFHNGRQTEADAYLLRVFSTYPERPWQSDMIGRGVPYVVLTFKGKAQDGDYQGFPQVKFEVDGHALYDPRDAAQNPADEATWRFTRNAAIIAYNVLRGVEIPGGDRWGIGTRKFLLPYVLAAANLCDEDVPLYAGGTRKRYEASLEIGVDREPHEALTEVLKAMGGDVADMGGTWLVRAGPPAGPVLSINDDDIIVTDSRSLRPYPGLAETVNAIHASYPDPDQQWEAKEAVPLYDAALEAKDGGRRMVADVNFPAVTNRHQVRALMREMLADHRRHRVHVITLPPDACGLRLGDHVAWSSVENGYNGKLFKVGQMRIDPVSLCVAVTLTERDPADYDYDAGSDALVPTIPSPTPVAPTIVGVFGWDVQAVTVFGATGARPGIRVGWNPEIRADALVWTIKLAATGAVVARGDVRALTEGFTVVTAGLLPSTDYLVSGRLVMRRRTLATEETAVTTHAVGISREELDVELRDALADFDQFVADTPALLDSWRDEIEGDIAAVDARVTAETADLSVDVAAARQLALDNLLVAQNYTDTSVQSETVARQTETEALAARIDQISAAPTSNNLLANPDFADGYTGWLGNGTAANGKATVGSTGAWQVVDVVFAPGEILQWRIEHSGPAGTARTYFQDSAGAWIGTQVTTSLPASTAAKIASGQHTPPDGAAKVRFLVQGSGVVIDNAAVTKIDQQILARIQSLEVATANDTQALATFKSQTNTRFGQNEAAITAEATARSNADSALSQRVSSVESTTSGHGSRITTAETTLADAVESIAQLSQLTEAESGRRDLVRDGTFERVATYWPGGPLPVRLVARDATSTDQRIKSVPAARYWNLAADDAAGTWRVSDYQPVTPGEVVEVSFDYARGATSVVPAVRIQTFNAAKTQLQTWGVEGRGAGGWRRASGALTVSTDAVYARVLVGVAVAGSSTAGITNISALRTGAGYASRGAVETLAQSQADDVQALANYKTQVASRFENVEENVQANANALLNVYTKAATNQAIAGQISEYNADVTNRLGQKASASTVAALDSRVKDTEDGLVATGNAITSVNSTVGRFSAGGLFRVQTVATPSDASSRIAIAAAASAGGATTTAGLYMDAVAGGKSRAVVVADLFAIASSTAPNAPKQFPFVVSGGNIWMDASVWIKELSIGPNKVQIDGLSTLRDATFAETNTDVEQAWVTVGSMSLVAYEAGTKLDITGHINLRAQIGGGTSISVSQARVLLNGVSLYDFSLSGGAGLNSGQYSETATRQSVAVAGRSVAGTNTVQVQVRQRQSSITPKGAASASIFVKEFKR